MSTFAFLVFEIEGTVAERMQRYYGELIGAAHKVQFIAFGLQEALRLRDLGSAIEHVEYHVEHYLSRVYQLRDRAIAAAETISEQRLDDLRHTKKRAALRPSIARTLPNVVGPLYELFELIDHDIRTRNTLTHRTFLHLHLTADDGQWLDPSNVLMGISDHPERRKIEKALRGGLTSFAETYIQRIESIFRITVDLANAFETPINVA